MGKSIGNEPYKNLIKTVQKKKLVVFTGAGVSAESGLKTFRDSDGLWNGFRIEDVATPEAWHKDPKTVLDFYNQRRRDVALAKPHEGHQALVDWQEEYDITIITQNIDDLHERAGSSKVLHLHGEIFKMRSEKNDEACFEIKNDIHYGDKAADGGQLRPHVVWFGEAVPMIAEAIRITSLAEIFVVIGTSLVVYPAASLVHHALYGIPKFLVDKKIPYTPQMNNLVTIEQPATKGIKILKNYLDQLKP
ncbi:MAG: NAD-dependent deacylase [Bacteroidetes bacterium]|nr:NAD-dependent deacylase [Bacteroidota bacterium]